MSFAVTAVVGSAAIGAYASNKASKRSAESAERLAQSGDEAAQLGRDQFDWYKAEYAKTQPQRDAAAAMDAKVADAQLRGMEFATQQAKDLDARNKTVFQPLEDKFLAANANYDTAGRRLQATNEAVADVESAFGRAQEGLSRDLARTGATPMSGRSLSLMQDAALRKATATTGATQSAVKNVEQQGYARSLDSIGLGKGIVGSQATQQNIATNTGGAATNAAAAGLNAAYSGAGLMQDGFQSAQRGLTNQAVLYGQALPYANNRYNQQQSALGQLGFAGGFMAGMPSATPSAMPDPSNPYVSFYGGSDKNIKSGTGKPADTKEALDQVEDIQVEDGWKYDEAKGAPPGMGDAEHTGPMAQRVRKVMGDKVAPGGKVIDMVSMNGKLMAAVQELSKEVKQLKKTKRAAA